MGNKYSDWFYRCFSNLSSDVKYIKKFCKSCSKGIILEPGSGVGRMVPHNLSPERKFLELCPEMIEIFLANHPREKNNLLVGSADKIPLPDESVSGIYVPFNGIGEFCPIVFSIREFYRILKKDGKLLICAGNPDFPMQRGALLHINESGNFQYTMRTIKTPKNDYSWQTTLAIRENTTETREHKFFINQYMLPRKKLENICGEIGFQTDLVHGNYDGSEWNESSSWTLITLSKKSKELKNVGEDILKLTAVYDNIAEKYDSFALGGEYKCPDWLKKKLADLNFLKPNILDLV